LTPQFTESAIERILTENLVKGSDLLSKNINIHQILNQKRPSFGYASIPTVDISHTSASKERNVAEFKVNVKT